MAYDGYFLIFLLPVSTLIFKLSTMIICDFYNQKKYIIFFSACFLVPFIFRKGWVYARKQPNMY
jgi:hypothetical protein